ncbi:hypothetical protein [Streptomyces sp. B29(2018)]|uniref:hypothetical protein n=1 Tax=Streptomyces sp. B29(2018) TaxID=2485016 RepID=UPI000FD68F71|nr:hypothetical protein [Streptomyces sp. B29(2018)]
MTTRPPHHPDAPHCYLDSAVPEEIREEWYSWGAATWRRNRHLNANNLFPPDQRYSVRPPAQMCPRHRESWLAYRNMNFDPVSGNRWPGHPGSPFVPVGRDLNRVAEERRCEWDEKASAQMRLIEEIRLSGRSSQCERADHAAKA